MAENDTGYAALPAGARAAGDLASLLAEAAEVEARANAATPGPWYVAEPLDRAPTVRGDNRGYGGLYVCETRTAYDCLTVSAAERNSSEADATFIAAARSDVPRLCAIIRRLAARVGEVE